MTAPVLRVRGLRKSFGSVEVLHGVDLDAPPGEVVALLGENGAGKSTLVRIVAGDHRPDEGGVELDGHPVEPGNVAAARAAGIRLIYQEISDAPPLTVAENVVLGAWPTRRGVLDRDAMRRQAAAALDQLGAELPLDAPVASLRLGERQLVEIARALVGRARCLILDEPTAALSDAEARRLFEIVERLREQGVAIVYITHRLDEVFRMADRVVVLRDGYLTMDEELAAVDRQAVITAMVGRAVQQERPAELFEIPTDAVPAVNIVHGSSEAFADVDLRVFHGQVRCLYGKMGSGVTEVAEVLVGSRPLSGGHVEVDGVRVDLRHPADAIAAGIGYVPPDRKELALFRPRSVAQNLVAASWSQRSNLATVRPSSEANAYRRWREMLTIRADAAGVQPVWTLSGGNQQKVVLARWLERGTRVLVLVEPTRGVDVGARHEIYTAIRQYAAKGGAVLVATSDYEDAVAVADDVSIMVRGSVVEHLDGDAVTVPALTTAAGGAIHA